MTKRANGEGSVYQRKDGLWAAGLSYAGSDGQQKRRTLYGRTQREVVGKLRDARRRVEAGAPVQDARVTVGLYVEHWIGTTLAASDRKETTKVLYAGLARTHLVPAPLGAITLDRLKPSDVEALVYRKRQDGKASSTVRQVYTVLRAVLDTAVRDEPLARNPAAAVKRPAVEHHEARYLTPDEVRALVAAIAEDRLRVLFMLLLGTGLRRGEALAAGWDDLDLDGGHLRVRGPSPASAASCGSPPRRRRSPGGWCHSPGRSSQSFGRTGFGRSRSDFRRGRSGPSTGSSSAPSSARPSTRETPSGASRRPASGPG